MTKLYFPAIFLCLTLFANAQQQTHFFEGGRHEFPKNECITDAQRDMIKQHIRQSQQQLIAQGKLPAGTEGNSTLATSLAWPLRLKTGLTDPSYYGISNYVDHNAAYPNQVQDYNCGTRTYDSQNGYNHAGIDVFTWPFGQQKQQNNEVEIVAAAAGTIIDKNAVSDDHSCSFCTTSCLWNAVYVQHADGSVAWYGHMKKNSLTSKAIGQTVAQGEFLGIVGSSGNSTGPHLHFELYANPAQTQLVDPWAGTCNTWTNPGLTWATQKPYRETMINRIQNGKTYPTWGACPALENVNEASNFAGGDTIYHYVFLHDETTSTPKNMRVIKPDGTIQWNWNHTTNTTYDASYWGWYNILPTTGTNIYGEWKFRVTIGAQVVEKVFTVTPSLPVQWLSFNAVAAGACTAKIDWRTATEINTKAFYVQRSLDGINFENAGRVQASGNSALPESYSFTDNITAAQPCTTVFYRIKQEDLDGKTFVGNTIAVQWNKKAVFTTFPNPAKDFVIVQGRDAERIRLVDMSGRILKDIAARGNSNMIKISYLAAGMYVIQVTNTDGRTEMMQFVKQ